MPKAHSYVITLTKERNNIDFCRYISVINLVSYNSYNDGTKKNNRFHLYQIGSNLITAE